MVSKLNSFVPSLKACQTLAKTYSLSEEHDILAKMVNHDVSETLTLLVCGEFKRGKSSLVNAILKENVCPVADGITTATVCIIKYGKTPKVIRYYSAISEDDKNIHIKSEEIKVSSIEQYAKGTSIDIDNTVYLEIELPNAILSKGLTIIDTPGIGSLDPRHLFLTQQALPKADAILFVTDVSEPMLTTELDFIKEHICPLEKPFDVILTKSDKVDKDQCLAYKNDVEKKIFENCNARINCIPVSSQDWMEFNETGNERRRTNSHCDDVLSAIQGFYSRCENAYLELFRCRYLNFLSSIKQEVEKSIAEVSTNNTEALINECKGQLDDLRKLRDMVTNESSEMRTDIRTIIEDSQDRVYEEFSRHSVLLSSEKLEEILGDERACADGGDAFVVRELNTEIQKMGESLNKTIDKAILEVLDELKDYIDTLHIPGKDVFVPIDGSFIPVQHTFSENFVNMTRQALPFVGVSTIGAGAVTLGAAIFGITAPIVAGVAGIAAGLFYVVQAIKGSKRMESLATIRRQVGPKITIAMNEMRSYIQKRYASFNKEVIKALKSIAESMTAQMQEKVKQLQSYEQDAKMRAQKRQELQGHLTMVNNLMVQTKVANTNPFAKA